METEIRYWPDDADGDALRHVASLGVDLDAVQAIDFNIDFDQWPPSAAFLAELRLHHAEVRVVGPTAETDGYVVVVIEDQLGYEVVTSIQASVTRLAAPFGGRCESWSVLH